MLRDFFNKNEKPTPVDDLIETVLEEMKEYGPTEPEYNNLMWKLERLNKLKLEHKPKRISRDNLFMGLVQLGGILIIVIAERDSILSTKALPFVRTMK